MKGLMMMKGDPCPALAAPQAVERHSSFRTQAVTVMYAMQLTTILMPAAKGFSMRPITSMLGIIFYNGDSVLISFIVVPSCLSLNSTTSIRR